MDLSSLIPMLASHGVKSFKGYGVEVELFAPSAPKQDAQPNPAATAAIAAQTLPDVEPDLSADDTMNYDKILFHSAPNPDEGLPLTGDAPLPEA